MNREARKRRTQAERREDAEARLMQAAIRLVAERGYDGFTLGEVGEAAGYSRGLPAHYFGRKDDLLARVAQSTVEAYHRSVARLPPTEPGLPTIFAQIRQYTSKSDDHGGRRAFMLLVAQGLVNPSLQRTILRLNANGMRGLEDLIRAGIEAGNIRPDTDVARQARIIYAFLRGVVSFAALDPSFDTAGVGEAFIAGLQATIGAEA